MDATHLLRAARRSAGMSQRALAARIGVSAATLASWESGRRQPSVASVDQVLGVCDLDVALMPRVGADADLALRKHLRLSLTQRLRLALGERHTLPTRARSEVWRELGALARRGQVVLEPPLAVALWIPMSAVERPRVSVFRARTKIESGQIEVRLRDGDAPRSVIPFMMEIGERVGVLPPGELAMPGEIETRLRLADQLLHAHAPLDDADRRRPAHRDPDEADEDYRMLRTKSVTRRPDMRDGRGWRLRTSASLAQRLRDEMTG